MSKLAAGHSVQPPPRPVIADLDQPVHVQPLHSVVKVLWNWLDYILW